MTVVRFIVDSLSNNEEKHKVDVEIDEGMTILDAAFKGNIPLEHSCDGCCACSTCHIKCISGAEKLSEIEECEEDRLDFAWSPDTTSRLACQAKVYGDLVEVWVPKDSIDPASYMEFVS